MAVVIRLPEVLTGATEATLAEWLVGPGDEVAVGQPIAEIETEKATVEYAAEVAGTMAGTLVDAGVTIVVGTPIAVLTEPGESVEAAMREAGTETGAADDVQETAAAEAAEPAAGTAAAPEAVDAPSSTPDAGAGPATPAASSADQAREATRLFASPLVRRIAREKGLDLAGIQGSGPGGRIVRRDVEGLAAAPAVSAPADAAAHAPAPAAAPAAATDTGYTDVPHSGMRRAIARRLTESKATVPHFYLTAECRVDALLELRRQVNETSNVRISVNDLIVKAVAGAFREVPESNAIWTDEAVRRFENVDVAVAVAIDGGLLTPVVRGVDTHSLSDVATQIRDLAERARSGKIKQHEIEGGSFTVSNLGMYGTQAFAAIINPPHAGILAVGAAQQRPVVIDGELSVATMMTVTLSADHRVLDGALAAQWLAAFVKRIENPLTILV